MENTAKELMELLNEKGAKDVRKLETGGGAIHVNATKGEASYNFIIRPQDGNNLMNVSRNFKDKTQRNMTYLKIINKVKRMRAV